MTGPAIARWAFLLAAVAVVSGCATAPFHRHLAARQWTAAADAFSTDASLMDDADALYGAGVLFGTPDRVTYHPERAADVLQMLLVRFPTTRHRAAAQDRLALLTEIGALRLELERLKEIDLLPPPRRPGG